MNTSAALLRSAARRLRLAELGRRFHAVALWGCGLALAALLAARLLGLLPVHWFTPVTLAFLPLLALGVALALTRRPTPAQVARVVDARSGSKELFLTAALLGNATGEYRALIQEESERAAGRLNATRLIPFQWGPSTRNVVIAFALVLAGALWLPRFDPFRFEEKRVVDQKREKRLEETKKLTELRKEELVQKGDAFKAQVEQALAKLEQTLKEAKPEQKEINAKKLNEQSQEVSELWKKAAAQLPREAMEKAAQQFGGAEQRKDVKEMLEKLKAGDPQAMQQVMEKLQEQMQKIAEMKDGAEKKEAMEKLAKELGQMTAQLKEQFGEKNLDQALSRALEQMDMAKQQGLSEQALEAARESMKLSQQEMEKMAEMFKDMKNLEETLKNLQAAKELNQQGKLDGQMAQDAGAKTTEDFQKLYEKLMAQSGAGKQPGQQQPGEGQGEAGGPPQGEPGIDGGGTGPPIKPNGPEDPKANTALKQDKAPSQLGAGKLLMEWKEDGVGETGKRSNDYQSAVRAVKEGVAEAIRSEQVPPGYHGAIQKYFDRLPEKPAGK